MKWVVESAFLLLINHFCITICNDENHGTKCIKYDTATFSSEILKKPHFVMFFAPWCGHCQRLAPVWDELSEIYAGEDSQVVIAKVDCTVETALCSEHGVTGYPTLKFYNKNAEGIRFRGSRDINSLQGFILDRVTEPEDKSTEATEGPVELTTENFASFVTKGSHFIKFYAPWCGHCQNLAPTWKDLAKSFEHDGSVTIAKVDCTEHRTICSDYGVKGYPTLLWIENGKMIERYSGSRSHDDLKAFVVKMKGEQVVAKEEDKIERIPEKSPGVVVVLNGNNFDNAIEKDFTFVKFYAPWCGHCKRLGPTWEELSKKFVGNGKVKVAKVDCTDEDSKELCSREKVRGFPTMILFNGGSRVGEYEGNRQLEDLHQYVTHKISGVKEEL